MRKFILTPLIVIAVAIPIVLAWVFFYPGRYEPPAIESPDLEDVSATSSSSYPIPFARTYQEQDGTFLVDRAHDNGFSNWELNVLLSRVINKGFDFEYLEKTEGEGGKGETPNNQVATLKEKLRYADAFAIVLPREVFSPEEVELTQQFVKKGGKLLLIGDPTRPSEINSVSADFGLIFEIGYLYNIQNNEGNYQNIFISEFTPASGVTKDLTKIVLYSSSSISSSGKGIAFPDANTLSSVSGEGVELSPLALTGESRVLAIADLTFMKKPYNTTLDNDRLISNIADWLTESERAFDLSDFPYFVEDGTYITYGEPSTIDVGVELKNFLSGKGRSAQLAKYQDIGDISKDMIFIGLFEEAGVVEEYLERGKISVTTKVKRASELLEEEKHVNEETPEGQQNEAEKVTEEKVTEEKVTLTDVEIGGMGNVYLERGTSVLYLDQTGDRDVLIVLSDSVELMKDTVELLIGGEFRNWLVSDNLAIYYAPVGEPTAVEMEGAAQE